MYRIPELKPFILTPGRPDRGKRTLFSLGIFICYFPPAMAWWRWLGIDTPFRGFTLETAVCPEFLR
jgi:hypothetical protein